MNSGKQEEKFLRNADYWRFLWGTTLSTIGVSATDAIWPILVYWQSESPALTSLTVVAQVSPQILFGLVAGYQVDTAVSKRKYLLYPNFICAIIFGVIGLVDVSSIKIIGIALFGYFITEIAAVYYGAATPSVLPKLVSKKDIAPARTLIATCSQILTFAIPGLAAFVLSRHGLTPVLFFASVSFCISVLFLSSITKSKLLDNEMLTIQNERLKLKNVGQGIVEGLVYLWRNQPVRLLTFAGIGNAASGGVVLTMYVVLLAEKYDIGKNDARITLFVYALAGGGVIGGVILPVLRKVFSPVSIALIFMACTAIIVLFLATGKNFIVALLLMTCWQIAHTVIILNAIILRMEVVEDRYLSRVSSTARMITWGAAPLGAVLAGALLSSGVSIVTVYLVAALMPVISVSFLWKFALASWRSVR